MFVHLDPRRKGVVVPKNFTRQHQLVLQVGLNMPLPIPDLEVGQDGISCTLSFNRRPFWCFMPWHAVYALVSEDSRGMVWPDDVPAEVAGQRQKPKLSVVGGKGSKSAKDDDKEQPTKDEEPRELAPRPRLAVATAAAMKLPPDEPEEPEPPKRAHLSVVPPPSESSGAEEPADAGAGDAEAAGDAGAGDAGAGDAGASGDAGAGDAETAAAAEAAEPEAQEAPDKPAGPPVLKSVPDPVEEPPDEPEPDDPGPGGLPPYLRVVK